MNKQENSSAGSSAAAFAVAWNDNDVPARAAADALPRPVRIFISSPSDVRPERLITRRIIERLDREFAYHFHVEAVLWEREPLIASQHFQQSITPPHTTDIVVVILWSRLGVPLPKDRFPGPLTGNCVTGTEWEFEDALAAHRQRKTPDLLFYRKTEPVMAALEDDGLLEQRRQQKWAVDAFLRQWFLDADAGTFTAAFREFSTAADFEAMLEDHLRELLLRRISLSDAQSMPASIRWHQGSPYRGLQSFDVTHAAVFFGRTQARNELRELLARRVSAGCAFVLVFGASGSGKSSLVKAGLLPDLKLPGMIGRVALCRHLVLRPSDLAPGLLAGAAAALFDPTALPELRDLGYDGARLAPAFADDPNTVVAAIRQGLAAAARAADLVESAEARLVLVLEQLEEIFTLDLLTPSDREAFFSVLELLARSDACWVIATMRSDFFDRLESVPALARLSTDGARYLLTPPDVAEFGQIIRRPAREAGVQFEFDPVRGVSLDEILLEAALKAPSALPVLAFALDQLWQKRTAQGFLTFAAYEELGGLEGAIGRRAEEEFANLPADVQAALPEVLRALATASQDVQIRITARSALLSTFPPGSPRRRLVDAFLAADTRLMIAEGDAEGGRVRLAHEALLTRWDHARQHLLDDCVDLQTRARLEQAAVQWQEAAPLDRDSLLLHAGRPLVEAQSLLDRRRAELEPFVVDYVEASTAFAEAGARKVRRRLRLTVALFALLSLLAGAGAIAAHFKREEALVERNRANAAAAKATAEQEVAQQNLEEALRNQSLYLASSAQEALDDSDYELAMLLSLEALPVDADAPNRPIEASALSALYAAVDKDRLERVLPQEAPSNLALFSPTGDRVLTAAENGVARLWRVSDGAEVARFQHDGPILAMAFSPAGDRVLTASQDATVRLWATDTGTPVRTLDHGAGVLFVGYSANGERILTASLDNTAVVWNAQTGAPLITLLHGDWVNVARFNRAGDRIVTASQDGTAQIWNAETGARIATLKHGDAVLDAAFNPAADQVATASEDYGARLWNARTGALIRSFQHAGVVQAIRFSPDGKWLLTASNDRSARLWNVWSGAMVHSFQHDGWVYAAEFSPQGNLVATISADKTAKLWAVASGTRLASFRHNDEVRSVRFNPAGDLLLTASSDRTARIWSTVPRSGVSELEHDARVHSAAFDPSGERMITTAQDGKARIWNARTGSQERAIDLQSAGRFAVFSPDGKRVVTASEDGRARLWDADSGDPIAAVHHDGLVLSGAFSPAADLLVTAATDGTARIVDVQSGTELARLAHAGWVYSALFSPGGDRLVTTTGAGGAHLWDARSGAEIAVLPHEGLIECAAFSPSGAWLVTGSQDHVARVWDVARGALLRSLQHAGPVRQVVFSPSGDRIATASDDRTARIWSTEDGAELASLPHEDWVQSIDFSMTGRSLLTASHDGMVRIWDTRTGVVLWSHHVDGVLVSAFFSPTTKRVVAIVTSDKVKLVEIGEITDVSALIDYVRAAHIRNFTQAERDRFFIASNQSPSSSPQPLDDTSPPDALALHASAIDAATGSRPAENPDGCATPWHHSDLAKSFHQQGDLRTALFHYVIASVRFAKTGAEREAALHAFRRGSLARTLPKSEVIAVWREAQEAMAAGCVRTRPKAALLH